MHQSSPYITEDDSDDNQVLLERMNYKETKDASSIRGHSVQISDGDIDNIVTLYRLRRASGRPADDT